MPTLDFEQSCCKRRHAKRTRSRADFSDESRHLGRKLIVFQIRLNRKRRVNYNASSVNSVSTGYCKKELREHETIRTFHLSGEAEVHDSNTAVCQKADVPGMKIAMDNALHENHPVQSSEAG